MNDDAHRDVIAVLTQDHRVVRRCLDELATTRDHADPKLREALVDQVTTELTRHAAAEERLVYPAVREHVPGGTELANRELRDNVQLKWTLRELEGVDPSDAPFEVALRRLTEQVEAHVVNAEETVFPRLRSYCPADDLVDLGEKVVQAGGSGYASGSPDHGHREVPMNSTDSTSGSAVDQILRVDARSGLADVHELAQRLRADAIRCSTEAGSGHPTSGMSAADVMAVLMARHLRYDWQNPDAAGNDHLIFSKGHASPLLYAMFKAAGVVSDDELVHTYRQAGSRLQGHPTPVLPWVDAATGSLGQGIGIGVGVALGGRLLRTDADRLHADADRPRIWVLCGDSETAEGSVWEALDMAGRFGLGELTVIVDVNRLGQRGPTELQWDLPTYARRVEAFGCTALPVDGHDLAEVDAALDTARHSGRPTVVLARTRKGRGVTEIEDRAGWHGKALPPDLAERALAELGPPAPVLVEGLKPADTPDPIGPAPAADREPVQVPEYELSKKVAVRKAFGDALVALRSRPEVVVLDAEVGNSTHTEEFAEVCPERFFESFIAEQQMVAAAVGLSTVGFKPFAATFAAFFSRAYDFVRMAAITGADLALCGTHCGVEIGEDGPSQMGLEDLAMMRAVHGSTVLYPSDANSAAALTVTMAGLPGISYLRATRGAYPVLYEPGEPFPIGGSRILHAAADDQVALLAAGVTVHECLKARESLAEQGISARVVDLYSVKPLDAETVARAAAETGAVVVVEDHHPEGALGEAVLSALAECGVSPAFGHLAVRSLPDSRSAAEQLDAAGLSAPHIVGLAKRLIAEL